MYTANHYGVHRGLSIHGVCVVGVKGVHLRFEWVLEISDELSSGNAEHVPSYGDSIP